MKRDSSLLRVVLCAIIMANGNLVTIQRATAQKPNASLRLKVGGKSKSAFDPLKGLKGDKRQRAERFYKSLSSEPGRNLSAEGSRGRRGRQAGDLPRRQTLHVGKKAKPKPRQTLPVPRGSNGSLKAGPDNRSSGLRTRFRSRPASDTGRLDDNGRFKLKAGGLPVKSLARDRITKESSYESMKLKTPAAVKSKQPLQTSAQGFTKLKVGGVPSKSSDLFSKGRAPIDSAFTQKKSAPGIASDKDTPVTRWSATGDRTSHQLFARKRDLKSKIAKPSVEPYRGQFNKRDTKRIRKSLLTVYRNSQ